MRVYYRVRFDGGGDEPDEYLGQRLVADEDRPCAVLEPDALCFDTMTAAADAAIAFTRLPFTVEVAS